MIQDENAEAESLQPQWAFNQGGIVWKSESWAKSLLLFFDGISLLVPSEWDDLAKLNQWFLWEPLQDQGRLQLVRPRDVVGTDLQGGIVGEFERLESSGFFCSLEEVSQAAHVIYHPSKLGLCADKDLYDILKHCLVGCNAAREIHGDLYLHPTVAQHLAGVVNHGILERLCLGGQEHYGVLDREWRARGTRRVDKALIVEGDLRNMDIDLSAVPLDDIDSFRANNRASLDRYRRGVAELSALLGLKGVQQGTDPVIELELKRRTEQFRELKVEIEQAAEVGWRSKVGMAMGCVGVLPLLGDTWVDLAAFFWAALQSKVSSGPQTHRKVPAKLSYMFSVTDQFP